MDKKKEIEEKLHTFSSYDFDKNFEDLAKIFNFKKWWKDNGGNPLIDINKFYSFRMDSHTYDDYGDAGCDFHVYAKRLETDEEFEKRIEDSRKRAEFAKKAAKTKKEAQEKREKTLYENLKVKYEK